MKFHPAIRAGLEIKVHEKAIVRTGFTTIPAANGNRNTPKASQLTFGFGTRVRKINLDIASSFHTLLGNSFQVSMHFDIRTK